MREAIDSQKLEAIDLNLLTGRVEVCAGMTQVAPGLPTLQCLAIGVKDLVLLLNEALCVALRGRFDEDVKSERPTRGVSAVEAIERVVGRAHSSHEVLCNGGKFGERTRAWVITLVCGVKFCLDAAGGYVTVAAHLDEVWGPLCVVAIAVGEMPY